MEIIERSAAQIAGDVNAGSLSARDVTEAVLFLAKDSSRRITGEVLHVSAGMGASNTA